MNIDNFKYIVIAALAGAAFGYLIFAVQEARATNEWIQKELTLPDSFIESFEPGRIENSMEAEHGKRFTE